MRCPRPIDVRTELALVHNHSRCHWELSEKVLYSCRVFFVMVQEFLELFFTSTLVWVFQNRFLAICFWGSVGIEGKVDVECLVLRHCVALHQLKVAPLSIDFWLSAFVSVVSLSLFFVFRAWSCSLLSFPAFSSVFVFFWSPRQLRWRCFPPLLLLCFCFCFAFVALCLFLWSASPPFHFSACVVCRRGVLYLRLLLLLSFFAQHF